MSTTTSAARASNTADDNNNNKSAADQDDSKDRFWIQVSESIPSVEECYAHCAADASCGAVSTFVGMTRNNFNGQRVVKLSYEGYVPMAEKLMRELCVQATTTTTTTTTTPEAAFTEEDADGDVECDGRSCATVDQTRKHFPSVTRIAMVHILGDCPVGRASVIIAASSPHRTDAMHCTEYLIHALKARIPIWKKEVYDDNGDGNGGGAVWKENVEWHEGRQRRVMVKQDEEEEEEEEEQT
jgi:molybdopterin synthase catalytic subunit